MNKEQHHDQTTSGGRSLRKWWFAAAAIVIAYALNAVLSGGGMFNFPVDGASAHAANDLKAYLEIAARPLAEPEAGFDKNGISLYAASQTAAITAVGRHWVLAATLNNLLYLLLLLVFTFLLARELADEETGVIAVLLVLVFPLTFAAFNSYLKDFPLMAVMMMSLYFLLRSASFTKARESLLFGASCGLGVLFKDTYGIYAAGPALFGAGLVVVPALRGEFRQLRLFVLSLLCAAGVALLFFHDAEQLRYLLVGRQFEEQKPDAWHSFANLRLFTVGLWERQLSPVFLAVVLWGAYHFRKKVAGSRRAALLSVILLPCIVLIAMPHWKSSRYLFPLQPLFAVIGAFGLRQLFDRRQGKLLLAALVVFGLAQNFVLMHRASWLRPLSLQVGFAGAVSEPGQPPRNAISYFAYDEFLLDNGLRRMVGGLMEGVAGAVEAEAAGKPCTVLLESSDASFNWAENILSNYFWFSGRENIRVIRGRNLSSSLDRTRGAPRIDLVVYISEDDADPSNAARRRALAALLGQRAAEAGIAGDWPGCPVLFARISPWRKRIVREAEPLSAHAAPPLSAGHALHRRPS